MLTRKKKPPLHVNVSISRIHVRPAPLGLVVARDISKRKEAEHALQLRDAILEAVSYSATRLLTAPTWESCADDVLCKLGEAAGMSRAYIYEYQPRRGGRVAVRRVEWHAEGAAPLLSESRLGEVPFGDERFLQWVEPLSQGKVVQGNAEDFPKTARDLLVQNGFQSLLVLPVFVADTWWGVIALGAATRHEEWPPKALTALQTAARALGAAVQRRRSEEAMLRSSRMEATATLAAGVAHDFNNLMVGVLGNADLLRYHYPEEDDEAAMLNEICQSAQRAGELAKQMLTYARGGTRGNEIVDVNRVVRDTIRLYRRSLPPSIRMDMELTDGSPSVEGDAAQLSQVVMNLCINAVEAMGDTGRVVVTTQCIKPEDCEYLPADGLTAREYICLRVTDNGQGMDAQTQARVFEPFFTTKFQGRGLGLACVYGIVRDHGGNVAVESQPGKGTTFRAYLPLTKPPEESVVRDLHARAHRSGTILIVDDDKTVVQSCERILTMLGHTVLVAESGQEAVKVAQRHKGTIHVALLDMAMPDLTGAETYPLLIETRPDMRILICSGYDLDGEVQGMLDAGAAGFLRKPFRISQLSDAIDEAMG